MKRSKYSKFCSLFLMVGIVVSLLVFSSSATSSYVHDNGEISGYHCGGSMNYGEADYGSSGSAGVRADHLSGTPKYIELFASYQATHVDGSATAKSTNFWSGYVTDFYYINCAEVYHSTTVKVYKLDSEHRASSGGNTWYKQQTLYNGLDF